MVGSVSQTAEIIELTKTCTKCGERKPLSSFTVRKHTYKKNPDKVGRRSECHKCELRVMANYQSRNRQILNEKKRQKRLQSDPIKLAADKKRWYENSKQKHKECPEILTCTRCRQSKKFDQFGVLCVSPTGRHPQCKSCMSLLQTGHDKDVREKIIRDQMLSGIKTCSTCEESKPLSEFRKSNQSKDGLFRECANCYHERRVNLSLEKRINDDGVYCGVCHMRKPAQEFFKDSSSPLNISYSCKNCTAERTEKWIRNNPQRAWKTNRSGHIRRAYGISFETYEALLTSQGHKCCICKTDLNAKNIAIDHCHFTGKVRGILCKKCNSGIGLLKDNPEFLETAAIYIRDRNTQ